MKMKRRDLLLAVMAAGKPDSAFTPVQIQKAMFLVDEELSDLFDGPHFQFKPYDYGPFDPEVYQELDQLVDENLIFIDQSGPVRKYWLTNVGYGTAKDLFSKIKPVSNQQVLIDLTEWILSLRFSELVSAIYKHYPNTKTNSIFTE